MTVGRNVGHELMEAYLAAESAPNAVAPSSSSATRYDKDAYLNAHNAAISFDHKYDNRVIYGFDTKTREYYVEKPGVLNFNGVQLPVVNRKVLYKK